MPLFFLYAGIGMVLGYWLKGTVISPTIDNMIKEIHEGIKTQMDEKNAKECCSNTECEQNCSNENNDDIPF